MVSEGALAPSGFPLLYGELVMLEGRQPLFQKSSPSPYQGEGETGGEATICYPLRSAISKQSSRTLVPDRPHTSPKALRHANVSIVCQ